MRSHSVVLAALVVALSHPPSLAAQRGQTFAESLDVNVVNIDVLVSNRQGLPATGLDKSAFQLREDDSRVKIDRFSESGTAAGLFPSIVVYVDDTHVFPAGRNAVLDALSPFLLDRMSSGETAVMVVRFDGFTKVLQNFTTSRSAVEAAIKSLKRHGTNPSPSMLLEREASRLSRGGSSGGGSDALGTYARVLKEDTTRSLGALTELAGSLGHRGGRKAFYVIADGLAVRPLGQMMDNMVRRSNLSDGASIASTADASEGQQLRTAASGGGGGAGGGLGGISRMQRNTEGLEAKSSFDLLAGVANSSKVTLYPIRPPVVDAAATGLGSDAIDRQRSVTDFREGPQLLADATGGLAFITGLDIVGFLEESSERGAALYSVGYTPDDHPDGSLHALRLKVKGRGLKVRHRRSYVTSSVSSQLADRAVGAATLGWVDNPHGIKAEIDEQAQAEDGNWNVTVLLTIPIRDLGLVEANGVHQTSCRVALLVVTESGGLTRPQYIEIPLQITESQLEEARKQVFGARANLRLPPGSHQLAVGLWDEIGGKGSYIASPIVVGQG